MPVRPIKRSGKRACYKRANTRFRKMEDELSEPTKPESLKGRFLISEANMADPNFRQTVVLMIEHNEEGAFGLVVNRRSSLSLADILPDFQTDLGRRTPIYVGGPVQQEFLFAMHSTPHDAAPSKTALSVVDDVFFEPGFRNIDRYFKEDYVSGLAPDDMPRLHLFLGYSGWGPGQLEREMKDGSWIIHPASSQIVFHPDPEDGWYAALREKGGIYRVFANTNPDPSLN